jgi:hypothetical protein
MTRHSLLQSLDRHPLRGFAAALLFGGVASLLRGTDTNWDLRNYHFYNPWAWWNGRLDWDYAPAQVQSYYSPLLDVPFFALVSAHLPSFAITFLMGIPFGVAVWFFARTARLAVDDLGVERKALALSAILVVALTGAAGLSQIGSTMNEWTTAALVLAALGLVVRAVRGTQAPGRWPFGFAGLLCGIATGLKMTAAIYAVSLAGACIVCFRRRPGYVRNVIAFAAAAATGFIVAYGYWGVVLWERFRNPFFPYFNGLFLSEYWEPRSFFDAKFHPKTLLGWITLPFGLAERNRLASEGDLRDPRLALLCVFALVLAASLLREARASGERFATALRRAMPPSVRVLAVFAGISYIVWLAVFTIYRYAIPLEVTASLLLVLAMRSAFAGAARRDVLVATMALLAVAVTAPPHWGRSRVHAGLYFDVSVPAIPPDSLLLTMTGQPFGYLVPFLPAGVRVIAPFSNFTSPLQDNRMQREMAALIAAQLGPLFAIRYLDTTDVMEEVTMAAYGLRRDDDGCQRIRSNLEGDRPLGVCPLYRRGQGP